MKISDIGGEFELIKRISKKSKIFSKDVVHGIGDDTAVLKFNKNKHMLFTTDMIIEDDHFSLKYFTPEQIGMKAIEVNVSDIASMGGIPSYALISLSLPKKVSLEFVDKLYKGFNKAALKYKLSIVGGDMTHSDKVVVNISMIGFVEKNKLCLRSDAKVNDLICVSGYLGGSTAGLNLLLKGRKGKSNKSHLEPKSRLDLARKIASYVNAMEDISDGLGEEIKNICKLSNVGCVLYKDTIPILKATFDDAKKVKKDAYDYALYGGEDFELVFTVSDKNYKKLPKEKITVVGKILPKSKGIYLFDKGRKIKIKKGYDHFG